MKKSTSLVIVLGFIILSLNQGICQYVKQDSMMLSEMKKLERLAGNWEGSGWMMTADRQKHNFNQSEQIQFKLNGTILQVEGKGVSNGEIIHQAFAIFNYDQEKGHYIFRSYLKDGKYGDYKAEFIEDRIFWYPTDFIRYIIEINEEGKWVEIGEINKADNWYKFFEMTLSKIN